MEKAVQTKGKISRLFWGRMVEVEPPIRVMALIFVMVSIASMSFCQLGFWPIGIIDEKPVYLLLILGPLAMGAFMFGTLTGALLGLYTGIVLHAHMTFFALDFYELYFMTPLNTFLLHTVFGALAGLLFSSITRRVPQGAKRVVLVVVTCLVLSFVASGFMVVNTIAFYSDLENEESIYQYLINSPRGLIVQALIDAALMMLLCLVVNAIINRVLHHGSERTLRSMFRNWMLVVSAIVFMLASAIIFSATSIQAMSSADSDMQSEADYLRTQINAQNGGSYDVLLQGYDVQTDGYVVITDEGGKILATDDEHRYPKGAQVVKLLGYNEYDEKGAWQDEYPSSFLESVAEAPEVTGIQAVNEDGVQTMDVTFLAAKKFDGGFVVIERQADMVFQNRLIIMLAMTTVSVLLIVAIALLASVLLNRVVVRRVDETNESLDRITAGDLNVRVGVRDSREFASLSNGINATVSALKETIDEVEQRNAQDLATAKAIQESALPRDFPPFPDIDRFDIYASMKTAKEVGGDFYDFFLVEDSSAGTSRLAFVVADVSGKGIPAALFMMTAKTQLRNYLESGMPVNEAVDAANHQLCIGNDAGMFVTAWVGILDYETGLLRYVNAGHNPPLLLTQAGWDWLKDVSGMPLGLFDGIPYDAFEQQLQARDVLYVYTDGVTEAMDASGELFGEARLKETLHTYGDLNPRSIGVGVRRALTDFTMDAEQSDDITMLCLRYGVAPVTKAVMVLPADDKQLVHVFNFIHEELHRRRAPHSVRNPLDIAAEELFVNVCHYAYPHATPDNPGEVRIGFEYNPSPPSLTVEIADDGIPYNPLEKPDAVTPDNIMDVPIGGLGILMAKRSVDEMAYRHENGSNIVTFRKGW